jgi:hypothetical protein
MHTNRKQQQFELSIYLTLASTNLPSFLVDDPRFVCAKVQQKGMIRAVVVASMPLSYTTAQCPISPSTKATTGTRELLSNPLLIQYRYKLFAVAIRESSVSSILAIPDVLPSGAV